MGTTDTNRVGFGTGRTLPASRIRDQRQAGGGVMVKQWLVKR
jgi:hypothetical protein